MLTWARSVIGNYAEHTILASLIVFAAGLAILAVIVSELTGNGVAAAHTMAYGVLSLSLAIIGYGLLFLGKLIRKLRREFYDVV
jgi:hypothetical protein